MAYTTIDDPSAFFQTALYTGNGGTLAVTNDGDSDLQSDWVWTKKRSDTSHHALVDSSRGATKQIYSNLTAAEETVSGVTAFNTDGFTLGSNGTANASSGTFAGWQWKANGGTTASNTDGTTTTTTQVNSDAGFSIVTYTGTGANATVGHGLGVTPNIVFYKNRTDSGISGSTNGNWIVQSSALNVDQYITLNEAAPAATDTGYFRSTRPSSTVLTLGTYNSNNGSSDNLIAYCFAEKQGYSKFGSYKSNGSEDGPFVYTGFKPAMIIAHRSSNNNKQWLIKDNARNPSNEVDFNLYPNSDSAETNTNIRHEVDFLSNGFKIRDQYDLNQAGGTFIYMAWAENPFVTSTGVPTTAR